MGQYDWVVSELNTLSFTAFDTETTGLDPVSQRIVEIGGIRFDSKGPRSRFNTLINPGTPMPSEASRINGITDAMLAGKPEAAIAIPDFLRFIGDSVLIAHNAPFDINFVNGELGRLRLPRLTNKVVDTRLFAKEVFPGLPKYALQDLAVRFGIQALEAHRAEDDARVCMELFLVCVQRLKELKPGLVAEVNAIEKNAQADEGKNNSLKTEATVSEDLFDDSEEDLFDEEIPI